MEINYLYRDRKWTVEYCLFTGWSGVNGVQFTECPSGYAVNTFESVYDQSAQDRQYRFGCTRVASGAVCSWTSYLNAWSAPVNKHCDGYIGGIQSIRHNSTEDRKWKIQCCFPTEHMWKKSCTQTSYINDVKKKIEFVLKPDQMFVGFQNFHENSHE